ncbi:MAG TPA: sulfurtransferase [Opitutae bacterium]|jgi:rhodanese-related sulfurtransferase|nr:sulfurtransferase [Opitutae bacterium]
MSPQTIAPAALTQLLINQSTVIDVRTPAEFKAAHVNGAQLQPLDSLDPAAFCNAHGTDEPVYILCQSGKRASIAADRLIQAGHQHIIVVEGGTAAAIEHGLDIAYGQGAISIERQVRIAAGLIVLTGTLLGAFIHPAFLIVPGFVGTGLAFAGITDTCGMALALTKCPWNQ